MAISIFPRGSKYRAQVRVEDVSASKTFSVKTAAKQWAKDKEREIQDRLNSSVADKTLGDMMRRYAKEVTPKKRGANREKKMIEAFCRDEVCSTQLKDLTPDDLGQWRDRRLRSVKPSTVNRELNIISNAFTVARREWRWIDKQITTDVVRPKKSPPRTRRPTADEIEQILYASRYTPQVTPKMVMQRVGAAYAFAIETAMRQGEIALSEWANLHERHIYLPGEITKTGEPRNVPLSKRAREIIEQLREVTGDGPTIFGLSASSIDVHFRKAKAKTTIEDLTFHDSRREALTRLAKVYPVMELAKISGHGDLKILQEVYYAPTADDLADTLDAYEARRA